MLAYDLYLKNKNYSHEFVGPELIKKILVQKDPQTDEISIEIDDTQLDVYGISESNKSTFQRIYQMPEKNKVKLPYRSTGSNSPKPYLEIKGEFRNKENTPEFLLFFPAKNKKPRYSSVLNLNISNENKQIKDSKVITNTENTRIKVKINKTDYYVDKTLPIYDLYVESNIITSDGAFEPEIFKKTSIEFFNFIKDKWTFDLLNKKERTLNFSLIILPTQKDIHYRLSTKKNINQSTNDENETIDSFGNETSGFPSETTQTAKFLSFDDPAFALNCKEKSEFYQNLSIGKKSLKSINIANDEVFNISCLSWMFTKINDPHFKFQVTKKGIYHQLLSNFNDLKQESGDSYNKQSLMKIICFEKNQAKLEILLNENLTMRSMKKIFSTFDEESQQKIPILALEIFIEKIKKSSGTKIVWSKYLDAIQSIINGKTMNRDLILSFFIRQIRFNIFNWLSAPKNNYEIKGFFERSEFCMKVLTSRDHYMKIMNVYEEYAYKIGLIAGRYVNFKKIAREESNTLKDILTYSKYDRERLRFVFQRIGLGINLSNSDKSNLINVSTFIKDNRPSIEITDEEASKDYSYFFYKGVFQELC
jgi:hypothetical protein